MKTNTWYSFYTNVIFGEKYTSLIFMFHFPNKGLRGIFPLSFNMHLNKMKLERNIWLQFSGVLSHDGKQKIREQNRRFSSGIQTRDVEWFISSLVDGWKWFRIMPLLPYWKIHFTSLLSHLVHCWFKDI